MKKTYYIPTIEVISLETERIMGMADPSNPDHPYAPSKRESNPAF